MGRRNTTVHDVAALRVHPDGTRVPSSLPAKAQDAVNAGDTFSRGLRPRIAKYTVQDTRGNLFARDAGGLGQVPRRLRAARTEEEEGESSELDRSLVEAKAHGIEDGTTPGGDNGSRGKKRAAQEVKDRRAKRRREFAEDYNFLPGLSPVSGTSRSQPSSQGIVTTDVGYKATLDNAQGRDPLYNWAIPSSDLLKIIHHFASVHYSGKGQLFDASREARLIKKIRRMKRLQAAEADDGSDTRANSSSPEISTMQGGNIQESEESEGSSEGDGGSGDESTGSIAETRRDGPSSQANSKHKTSRPKRHRRGQAQLRRDMYKAFDGSALVALGMLVQEHVASLVAPHIPEEWEEDMENHNNNTDANEDSRSRKRGQKKSTPRRGLEQVHTRKTPAGGSVTASPAARDENSATHDTPEEHTQSDSDESVGNLFDGGGEEPVLAPDNSDDSDYVP
ncbi:hypothetical protein GLOTRDRAFT_69860 [Gloeophyllum trabeum ATCC 11539]|uniref:Uncharacterized protein n=1 Tax=Gloeophyllum trabeum (strain ATCC 11539 / FP-39264 / Madison 617) TaxID=670483 RepID=S7QI18_GLOTA|nr:uncharacterized protein GLOTRDRAFT_69860 [Gloeophyllum trabeum ATCC 11539]EPQ58873.1 hypothetical protein GLOTRDRAFT_69860 [Gloeophyllum trabeum ATCC 11539]